MLKKIKLKENSRIASQSSGGGGDPSHVYDVLKGPRSTSWSVSSNVEYFSSEEALLHLESNGLVYMIYQVMGDGSHKVSNFLYIWLCFIVHL